jgi:hypothetical protein
MYSQSSSFMGGSNSTRPAPGQFGQPQQSFNSFQQPQQQQPQPSPFAPQPTGYGANSIQPQFTGYPGPGLQTSFQAPPPQPQFTGYQPPGQPPQQPSFQQPPQPQSFQPTQAQQIQQPQQPPAAPLRPQQTSSQIVQSFQGASSASAAPVQSSKQSGRIPNIRLSFITATDQAKFEQLFKSAVGDNKAMDGKACHVYRSGNPLTTFRRKSERSPDAFEVVWQRAVADMVRLNLFKTSKHILIVQDTLRYYEVRPAAFPRVRVSYVSLQPQTHGKGPPSYATRKGEERSLEHGGYNFVWRRG